jgi:AcrR family transcriptional regulator
VSEEIKPVRRRTGLLQERSRLTRQRLVRAALDIWTERGFEDGVESTTVDEIVKAAGVTKGTFYFHFARKEEILLEMGWDTAFVVNEEARRCIKAGRDLEESLARAIAVMTRHVRAAPPAAVGRSVTEFRRTPPDEIAAFGRLGFGHGLEQIVARAVATGELSPATDPVEISQILQALWMDSVLDWAAGHSDLAKSLRSRTALVVSGLRHLAPA